jgi:hypothetical protein
MRLLQRRPSRMADDGESFSFDFLTLLISWFSDGQSIRPGLARIEMAILMTAQSSRSPVSLLTPCLTSKRSFWPNKTLLSHISTQAVIAFFIFPAGKERGLTNFLTAKTFFLSICWLPPSAFGEIGDKVPRQDVGVRLAATIGCKNTITGSSDRCIANVEASSCADNHVIYELWRVFLVGLCQSIRLLQGFVLVARVVQLVEQVVGQHAQVTLVDVVARNAAVGRGYRNAKNSLRGDETTDAVAKTYRNVSIGIAPTARLMKQLTRCVVAILNGAFVNSHLHVDSD